MTTKYLQVLNYLQSLATGRENAKTINQIRKRFNCFRRTVEKITEEMRSKGYPLCAAVKGEPKGLYLAKDYAEALPWYHQIDSRMKKMAIHRAQALKTVKALADRDGVQLNLELELK